MNVHEAKTHLSKLLAEVSSGKEIVISKAGRPIAKLVPYTEDREHLRTPGGWQGRVRITADSDAISEDMLDAFGGRLR